MKYTHAIIYKGKYYRAGEDVPIEEKPTGVNNTPDTDKNTQTEKETETDKNTEAPKKRGKTKA